MTTCVGGDLRLRLVGDPIDVVTGAVVERTRDALIPARVPLEWYRYYSSASTRLGPLGWAHRHHYECELRHDVDGLTYVAPDGSEISFPPPLAPIYAGRSGRLVLRRLANGSFELERGDDTFIEFRVVASAEVLRPVAYTWSGKFTLRLHYDAAERLVGAQDGDGRRFEFRHSERGRLTAVVLEGSGGAPPAPLVRYEYDTMDRLVRIVDAYGGAVALYWDAGTRVVERVERSGYHVRYVFDAVGRCVRSEGEDGVQRVTLRYDPAQRRTLVERADGGLWMYEYDERGIVTAITDPGGVRRAYRTDAAAGVIEIEAGAERPFRGMPFGAPRRAAADFWPQGRHTPALLGLDMAPAWRPTCAISYEYGASCAYSYIRPPTPEQRRALPLPTALQEQVITAPRVAGDPLGTPRPGVLIASRRTSASWEERDRVGTIMRRIDPSGSADRYSYDSAGNTRLVHDRDGARWEHRFASWNHRVATTDPQNVETHFRFGPTEQLTAVEAPFAERTTFEYDLNDRLTAYTSSTTGRVVIHRDALGRETGRTSVDGSVRIERSDVGHPAALVLPSGERHEFEFDATGRCVAATCHGAAVKLEYAGRRRLAADVRDGRGVRVAVARDRIEYEVLGRFRWQLATQGSETVLLDPTGKRHRLARLPHGLFVRTFASGLQELAQFDWAGRCLGKTRIHADGRQRQRRYEYSAAGDLLQVVDGRRTTASFQYDAAHRLSSMRDADGTVSRFEQDGAGNLVGQPGLTGVKVMAGNRLARTSDRAFQYDAAGRLVRVDGADSSEQLTYDELGRLVAFQRGALRWRAEYDAFGRRIRTRTNDEENEWWWYGEQLVAERGPSGAIRLYVYADPDAVVPMLCVDYDAETQDPALGRAYAILTNQLGAPESMEDMRGSEVWRASSSPFGALTVREGAQIRFALRFPGQWADDATGLHYNRHRYYSPALGRYIQPDPCGIAGGLNLYAFSARPTCAVDVDGLACPIRTPDPDDDSDDAAAARHAREEAASLAAELQAELDARGMHGTTVYSVLVVVNADGSRQLVVTHNGSGPPHAWAAAIIQGQGSPPAQHVQVGNMPPMMRDDGTPMRDSANNPVRDPSTLCETADGGVRDSSGDAEQRGLRWADQQNSQGNVQAVEGVSPTQGCCKGCEAAIENRGGSINDAVVPPNNNTPSVQRGDGPPTTGLPSPPINS